MYLILMKCKVIFRMDSEYMCFIFLIDTVYFISGNNNENHLVIGDWVQNVERFQKNEGCDQLKILFCILLLTSSMYRQLISRFQEMTSLLGNYSYGFGDGGVVWYDFIYELVANITLYVFLDNGDVI